jgi:hypothetical protein
MPTPETPARDERTSQMKINQFRGYRYRRYGAALIVAAVAWFPYAAHTFFIFPSFIALVAAIVLVLGGCIPLLVFALHCFNVADDEFNQLKR